MSNDPSGKPPSTGLFVGCFIDVATGVVRYISHSSSQFVQLFIEPCSSFTCEGKEIKQRFKMEPGTKLFPSVFLKASSKDALQVAFKGAGSFHIHRKIMKELGALAVLGIRERPNLAHNLVTHRH